MLDKKEHQKFFYVKTLYYLNTIISFMKDSFFLRKAKKKEDQIGQAILGDILYGFYLLYLFSSMLHFDYLFIALTMFSG